MCYIKCIFLQWSSCGKHDKTHVCKYYSLKKEPETWNERMTVVQLIKKFFPSWGTRKFITVIIRVCKTVSVSQLSPVYTMITSYFKVQFNIIFQFTSSYHVAQDDQIEEDVMIRPYTESCIQHLNTGPDHHILLDLITLGLQTTMPLNAYFSPFTYYVVCLVSKHMYLDS
jgi:hypothetical protein